MGRCLRSPTTAVTMHADEPNPLYPENQTTMTDLTALPHLNAFLNSIATVLLLTGFYMIRQRRISAHQKIMLSAFCVSTLFMVSYLTFHFQVGSVGYDGTGWIRPIYYVILISHIILAVANLPMILITLYLGWRRRDHQHRRMARWTWPIWLYVSVTGVIIYAMMQVSGSYEKLGMLM